MFYLFDYWPVILYLFYIASIFPNIALDRNGNPTHNVDWSSDFVNLPFTTTAMVLVLPFIILNACIRNVFLKTPSEWYDACWQMLIPYYACFKGVK